MKSLSVGGFILIFVCGMLTGVVMAAYVWAMLRPYCPTEDSCEPAYQTHWYGNGWAGKEVTP